MTINSNEYKRCVDTEGEHYVHEDAFKKALAEIDRLKKRAIPNVSKYKNEINKLSAKLVTLTQDLNTTKQALQSESMELVKVRKQRDDAVKSSNFNFELSEKRVTANTILEKDIRHLENQMRTLRQCLKDIL